MDYKKEIMLSLGRGPKTAWWIATELGWEEKGTELILNEMVEEGDFVEVRGIEYLYPQTDRLTGVRRKRGKRYKSWTETRTYYALTHVGRVLLPLESMRIGAV